MIQVGPSLAEWQTENGDDPSHYIYGLHDPRTLALRYIGKSDNPAQRLARQMNERAETHRCHWIGELRSLGLRPIQVIIDSTPPGSDWQSVEQAYIAAARAAGDPLTNGTDGGGGVVGLSAESRERMRRAWTGRKHTPEELAKMSAASLGRKHTESWRLMMSRRMSGREFSAEHRARLRRGVQKLAGDQVREIRALLARNVSQCTIAAQYGVHQGTISNIARGITYRDIGTEGVNR
jgi:hypothetical protein